MSFGRAEVRKRHLHDAGETVPSLAAGRRKISQLSLKRSGGRGPWAIGNTSKRVHYCFADASSQTEVLSTILGIAGAD